MRYSARERRWYGKRAVARSLPADGYAPGSPGYAVRHRETQTVLGNGLVRVDLGEPVPRLPGEAPAVPVSTPTAAPSPAPPPAEPEPAPPVPAAHRAPPKERKLYGLGKDL